MSLRSRANRDLRPTRNLASLIFGVALITVPSLARAQVTLPFKDVLFVERGIRSYPNPYDTGGSHNEADGFHFCDEYFGHNGRTGGGLFILKDFQSTNPQKVDVVAGLKVPAGKVNAGQTLSSGTFLSPDLSFDGKTVVFAWSSGGSEKWQEKNRFHIFKVNIDGTNLVQLTDGNFDDIHPAWMPNGRIVFVSTRRGGYGRCHGRPVPGYTLHSMKGDGSDIIRLSHHETNEFHPSIANDGRIIYTRWDYVDRDFSAAHHLWICNPDGSNPRSYGGNYALPTDTLGSGPWSDGRFSDRPFAEFYGRSIPGSGTKYVATAGPHHGEAYGTLIVRDYSKVDDNKLSQVTKLTPEIAFPEAMGGTLTYGPAYPLSETLFLTSFDNKMVLLDTSVKPAKRTELYATKDLSTRPLYTQPVMARTPPPIITETTYQGDRWSPSVPPATIQVVNVYTNDAYGKLPADVKIKSMRIVQVLPKTTQLANDPRIGYSSQNVAKMALGTVPVEEDGSVFFEAPIGKEILFQVLDERGFAVQTMRSGTYLHPGENMTCVGCHEDKWAAPPTGGTPMASKRPASKLEPELGKVEPINFARNIAPILKNKCFACHQGKTGSPPTDASYSALEKYAFYFMSDGSNTVAGHGGSRSKPGQVGARGSRMGKALMSNTHTQAITDGKITETDVRTVVQWLDLGSDELGAFDNAAGQKQGQLVWPTMDVDKNDPQGLKYDCEGRPCSTGTGGTGGTRASSSSQGGSGGAGSGTPVGGSQTGGTGAGGSKGTNSSGPSGGSGAGGSTSTPVNSQSGGSGSGGSKSSSSSSSSGGAGGESSKSSGSSGGQSSPNNSSSSKGGNQSESSSSSGQNSNSSNGKSNSSSATAQASSGGGCSLGTETRTPAHALVFFVIGVALLVRRRRKP